MRFADILVGEFIPHQDWVGIHDNTAYRILRQLVLRLRSCMQTAYTVSSFAVRLGKTGRKQS